jgi:hypothetical protein
VEGCGWRVVGLAFRVSGSGSKALGVVALHSEPDTTRTRGDVIRAGCFPHADLDATATGCDEVLSDRLPLRFLPVRVRGEVLGSRRRIVFSFCAAGLLDTKIVIVL